MKNFFVIPAAVSLLVLGAVLLWSGVGAFLTVAALSILEIGLSFDNAVVNAKILRKMTPRWRGYFLTWGIAIAVVGTRLVLPIILVSATAWLSPITIAKMAFFDAARYASLISDARFAISAFGGAFLAMVSLRFFIDTEKNIHWIHTIERRLSKLGDLEALEMILTLTALLAVALSLDVTLRAPVIIAGMIGVMLAALIDAGMDVLSGRQQSLAAQGIGLFIYLNVLDAAFSLDGVVGAFAITASIPLIVLGLGIGAYFVRAFTVYLTERGTLDSLAFIEHGAYWAIFGLALSMFANLLVPVPEFVSAGVGLAFMLASFISSLHARPRH